MLKEAVTVYGEDWVSVSAYIAGRVQSGSMNAPQPLLPVLPSISQAIAPTSDVTQQTHSDVAQFRSSELAQSIRASVPTESVFPSTTSVASAIITTPSASQYRVLPSPAECAQRWASVVKQASRQYPPWTQAQVRSRPCDRCALSTSLASTHMFNVLTPTVRQ
jgi:hypothetical protein